MKNDTVEIPRTLKVGGIYRHFKNKHYKVHGTCFDSETKKEMVFYQRLYGDYSFWVRPVDMFLSEVDHEKYPEVKQKWRFEEVASMPE